MPLDPAGLVVMDGVPIDQVFWGSFDCCDGDVILKGHSY